MKKKLKFKELVIMSFMIFGIFFGAGNLIFPLTLGKAAGSNLGLSLIFFAMTAVIFPMLGIVSSIKMGGMDEILNKMGYKFKILYPLFIYLSLGPGLAIPRAGSMAFETFKTGINLGNNIFYFRIIATFIFFFLVLYLSLNPSKIFTNLGKILTPTLITLMILMFLGVIFKKLNTFSEPNLEYLKNPLSKSFLEGYNTMDALGSMIVGYTVYQAFERLGFKNSENIIKNTIKSTFFSGLILFSIYSMLAYIGAVTASLFPNSKNGVEILNFTMKYTFGNFGMVLLILIFVIACLSASVGLSIAISSYFADTYKFFTYKKWVSLIVFISFVLSNFGLDKILVLSIPILLMLYPVTLVLILLPLFTFNNKIYRVCTYTSLIISVISVLNLLGLKQLSFIEKLPLNSVSMSWVIPTVIVFIISSIFFKLNKN